MSFKLHNKARKHRVKNLLWLVLLGLSGQLLGQATYQWNLAGDGTWSTPGNWMPSRTAPTPTDILIIGNGGTKTINSVPTQMIGRLIIQGNTNVTLNGSVVGPQTLTIGNGSGTDLVVAAGSSLTISTNLERIALAANSTADISGTFTCSSQYRLNAAGVLTTVTGTFILVSNSGVFSGESILKLTFAAGSTYQHARNGGSLPAALWHNTSTCLITGRTNSSIGGMNQIFGNFKWNCPMQNNGSQNFPSSGSMVINGNLEIMNTGLGSGQLDLSQSSLSVGGNFTLSGGEFRLTNGNNDRTLIVNGNTNITGGTLLMADGNGSSTGVGTLSVKGNYNATGGTITETSLGDGYGNILFDGTVAQTVIATGAMSDSINVSVDNSMNVLLASDLTIPGDLTMISGLLSLGAFDLEVGGTAAGSSASYVQTNGSGSLRQTAGNSILFPIGNSSYNPVTLTNAGTEDVFSARVTDQVLSNGDSGSPVVDFVVNRTWFIEEDVPGDSDLDITLQWNPGDQFGTFTPGESYIAHYTSGAWVGSGVSDGSGFNLTFSGVTTLSPFAIGSQGALPVELVAFSAVSKGKTVLLNWRTATELNNAFFYIERSADGRDFKEIGKIAGAGTSHTRLDYAFTDQLPQTGWNYYRLRQVDFDGQFSYSPVQAVLMGKDGSIRLQVFPNPANNELNLKTDRLIEPADRLEIYDYTGRQVLSFSAADVANAPIDISQLPAGTYFVRLRTAEGTSSASFVKQ